MRTRLLLAVAWLLAAVWAFGQLSDSRHREEETDQEILELHDAEAAERRATDFLEETQARVRRSHGQTDHTDVQLCDGYVMVGERESGGN